MLRQKLLLVLLPPVLIALCAWGDPGFTGSDHAVVSIDAPAFHELAHAHPPQLTAQSAELLDFATNTPLWQLNAHEKRAPASLTKMMTALIVRNNDSLDHVITVSAHAAATPGSRMGLIAGERFTVLQLLYGLLLPSGNDAAVALAEGTAGSESAFVTLMNTRAAEWHLNDTHYVNPHGLDAPGHLSSAADLAELGRAVLRDPVLSRIVRTRSYVAHTVTGAAIPLHNLDELLGTYPGTIGIKTGTTAAAEENLVSAVERNGHILISVILGSTDRYADARALLNYAWSTYGWITPSLPPLATLDHGAIALEAVHFHSVPIPRWELSQVSLAWSLDPVALAHVPVGLPTLVGTVNWQLGRETIARASVAALR